jgi:hypothetical protein
MNTLPVPTPIPVSDFIQFDVEELPNGITLHRAPAGIYIYVEHTYDTEELVVSHRQLPLTETLIPNRGGTHDIVFMRLGPFETLEGAKMNMEEFSLCSDVESAERYAADPRALSWMKGNG